MLGFIALLACSILSPIVIGGTSLAAATTATSKCSTALPQAQLTQCVAAQVTSENRILSGDVKKEEAYYKRALVVASEKAWSTYRAQECKLEASIYKGGTVYPLINENCELALTRSRVAQIETVISNGSH